MPNVPKPPEVKLSLSDLEAAKNILKPNGEAESEENFSKELEHASEIANPGNETLKAMEQ